MYNDVKTTSYPITIRKITTKLIKYSLVSFLTHTHTRARGDTRCLFVKYICLLKCVNGIQLIRCLTIPLISVQSDGMGEFQYLLYTVFSGVQAVS